MYAIRSYYDSGAAMAEKGDIYDLGTNEYLEFIENIDDLHDYVIYYTRESAPSLAELKIHRLIPADSLDGEYRKRNNFV